MYALVRATGGVGGSSPPPGGPGRLRTARTSRSPPPSRTGRLAARGSPSLSRWSWTAGSGARTRALPLPNIPPIRPLHRISAMKVPEQHAERQRDRHRTRNAACASVHVDSEALISWSALHRPRLSPRDRGRPGRRPWPPSGRLRPGGVSMTTRVDVLVPPPPGARRRSRPGSAALESRCLRRPRPGLPHRPPPKPGAVCASDSTPGAGAGGSGPGWRPRGRHLAVRGESPAPALSPPVEAGDSSVSPRLPCATSSP